MPRLRVLTRTSSRDPVDEMLNGSTRNVNLDLVSVTKITPDAPNHLVNIYIHIHICVST
jgi:hypothetical protein